jgi:amino acid adenylation domain-containing protein
MTPSDGFRLSPGQRYLWARERQEGAALYVARCRIGIQGDVDHGRLERALAAVVARHEILRTRFVELSGLRIPVQVIQDEARAEVDVTDCGGVDSTTLATIEHEIGERAVDDSGVLRAHLLLLAPDRHRLLLSAPGPWADGATLQLVAAEIGEAYAAPSRGRAGSDSNAPAQFADLAEWLNVVLESPDVEAARRWWERQGGFPASAGTGSPSAAFVPTAMDVDLTATARASLSLPRLLACAQVLSWKLSADPAPVVGVGVDGRASPHLADAHGPLSRYVPVRGRVEPDLPFCELVDRADAQLRACDARAHFLPFPAADFQWPIVVDAVDGMAVAESLAWRLEELCHRYDRARLRLSYSSIGARALRLEYDGGTVSNAEALRWRERIHTILEHAAERPDAPAARIEVAGREERRTIAAWNPSRRAFAPERIDASFRRAALANPRATAVVCEESALAYADLVAWSDGIAADLRRRGVGPDEVVGLRAGRTLELVAGLAGILASGAAYLPIESTLPPRRAAYLLEDTRARLLVCAPGLDGEIPGWSGERLCLARPAEHADYRSPLADTSAAALAYVIYTSGSTGRPKGVAVEHRHVMHYVRGMLERFPVPAGTSFATASSFAMDLGNTAVYLSLATGGTLHLIAAARAADPDGFRDYLQDHQIDVLKIVPSHLESLMTGRDARRALPRRVLILGGESPGTRLLASIADLAPDLLVINHYGPTETTIGAATSRLHPNPRADRAVTIGRPLPNTTLHVLDEGLRPVPIGATGELYIGGGGVARGYVNLPSLTASRFVPDPAGSGERLYRTGDRGRHREDGEIEFLGRVDDQMKIRGFRVEPSEVDAVIRSAEGVRQAAVIGVPADAPDRLVAFIVLETRTRLEPRGARLDALRAFLAARLPDHLLPAELVVLDSLPLTANGKIDRRQLAASARDARAAGTPSPPADALELAIARIWEELLNVRPIGVTDSFFQLGGHSLLAIRLLARIRQDVDPSVALTTLLQGPTVRELAAAVRASATFQPSPLVPLQPRGSASPLFFVHGGWGDVLSYAPLAHHLGESRPFFGLQAVERKGPAIPELAATYIDAIRSVRRSGPYLLGGWSFGGVVAYEMACQLRNRGDDVRALVLVDAVPPGAPAADLRRLLATVVDRLEGVAPWLTDPAAAAEAARWLADATRLASLHHDALLDYAPPPCDAPMLLVQPAERFDDRSFDAAEAWQRYRAAPIEIVHTGGNHLTMLDERHVAPVADAVREFLARETAGVTVRVTQP